ncbi:alkaline phosphatase-like protein [Lophium mytilinum]|uniref:Alkaline phosphatase-like protein n=1 Tax=Lophium mytilinum TaxID=390894 RepID=A0A6A6QI84_9PEZI|nr:alkaline phosphatase-like protein [Lophium mytilinum]
MSGSLPFTLFGSLLFNARNSEFCLPRPPKPVNFPFEKLLANATWEQPDGNFAGWMPQSAKCVARNGTDSLKFYDPSCDPLRISNLDQDILGSLSNAFADQETRPSIKHVVVLTLESTRKDIFPFKKDSRIHDIIRESWSRFDDMHKLDEKLFEMTPIASLLTGESMGFENLAINEVHGAAPSKWTDRFNESFGGINVQGAYTGAGYTFKSLVGGHCGVEPLPVDFTEEVKGHIYQPCIPHILDLFNKHQNETASKEERDDAENSFLSSDWESVIVQSITDQFDSQDILDDHMGFRKAIMKSTLLNSSSKYYPPKQPESNYFGFPETEVLPYMRDLFTDAEARNKRLFLSHITSSTHHPYSTPKHWGKDEDYMARNRWGAEDSFNAYLNTVKYQDEWIYTIFNMLEEVGVLNETLVVLVGDHGMTFDTIDGSTSTFENGHINNFRVPLLFVHPNLPRVQINAKTTSISIIPTLLDLLIQTHSLDAPATETAQHLIQQYQGQSLIRTFVPEKDGRQLWYFGVINPGGSVMVISSAATSYRLVFPLCSSSELRFTDVVKDPAEEHPIEAWTIEKLVKKVKKDMEGEEGEAAAEWIQKAEMLGRWWFWEQRERWDYHLAAKGTDRSAENAGGGERKKHWWETR